MTKDALWAIYTAKNTRFLTDGASFTSDGLKKFFDQTWEQAHQQGIENGKALAKRDVPPKWSDPMEIFKIVFGNNSPL